MPRRSLVASVVLLFAAGCTGGEPIVTGAFGARPTISFPAGAPPGDAWVAEAATGDGEPLETGVAVVHYTAHRWDGRGNRLVESTFNRGVPAAVPLDAPPGELLRGHRAGGRVTAAVPSEGLFYVVDVLGGHAGDAAVEAGPGSVAGVRVGGGSPPALTIPPGPPPGFASVVLARGSGPPVETGRLLVVQYAVASWSGGRVVASTWARGRPEAVTIGDGSVIGGWDRALAGVPAGSRVAVVAPPGDAYGMSGTEGIAPGETLVYVVDVLGVY